MTMETERLVLRPWGDADAGDLFAYASDPAVGPAAGWPAHTSVEESLGTIRGVLGEPEQYAICPKPHNRAIGAVGLKLAGHTSMTDAPDECELGFWLGKPFWGRGIMPEAVRAILRHAFQDLQMACVWAGYYDGNHNSRRVQDKCGFVYQRTIPNVDVPLLHEVRTEHVTRLTRADWRAANGPEPPREG